MRLWLFMWSQLFSVSPWVSIWIQCSFVTVYSSHGIHLDRRVDLQCTSNQEVFPLESQRISTPVGPDWGNMCFPCRLGVAYGSSRSGKGVRLEAREGEAQRGQVPLRQSVQAVQPGEHGPGPGHGAQGLQCQPGGRQVPRAVQVPLPQDVQVCRPQGQVSRSHPQGDAGEVFMIPWIAWVAGWFWDDQEICSVIPWIAWENWLVSG